MSDRPIVLQHTPDHCLATWRHVVTLVYTGHATRESLDALRAAVADLRTRDPRPVAQLTVIAPNALRPPVEIRQEIAAMLRGFAGSVACAALAYEGEGLRAATIRSLVTSMTVVARQPFPYRVFSGVPGAAEWLVQTYPPLAGTPAERLVQAVEAQRCTVPTP